MIRQAILRGADAADQSDQLSDRDGYLNASEALSCARKQWYNKNADPAQMDSPEMWGYARRGKHGEKYIVDCLRRANVAVMFGGDDQVRIVDEDLRIAATPDGVVWDDERGGWLACEFKTKDPRTNTANLPREEHVRQVQIAAALFTKFAHDFPELMGKPIVGCVVVYMDASNYDDLLEFPVPLKPAILDQLKGRANRILDATSAARLPREGAVGTKAECKQRCKWNGVCGLAGAGTSTAQGVKGGADGGVQVEAYLTAKLAEAAAKIQKDEAAERLKAILKKAGKDRLDVDGHTVTLTQKAGSVSYATVVKEHCAGVDLEPYRGHPSEVLTVK